MPPKIDPTHFHPTTPQASSKSVASHTFTERVSRKPRFNAPPAPSGETPQEKVKRLRAAAARAKEAEISSLDKFLVRGRVWADRAHRITTWSLIAFTGMLLSFASPKFRSIYSGVIFHAVVRYQKKDLGLEIGWNKHG